MPSSIVDADACASSSVMLVRLARIEPNAAPLPGIPPRQNPESSGPPFILPMQPERWRSITMRMLVLGAGLQGSACAYDLLQNPEVEQVRLADISIATSCANSSAPYSGKRLIPTPLDVRDRRSGARADARVRRGDERDPVLLQLRARQARRWSAGVHFCDLGGNTDDRVSAEGARPRARSSKGVTVDPRLRARAGDGEHPRRSTASSSWTRVDDGEDLRRRTAAESGAAAQLSDRVLARGGARLLHDAVVGRARRQAHAGEGAVGARARAISPRPSASSRRSTPPADSPRWRSATRARFRRWSTRRSDTRATRRSWRRFATSGCSIWSRWT